MTPYIRNRSCHCVRCRAHGLMGAAVLITLGVLFLMQSYDIIPFDRSFPVLLLVIGCVLLVSHTGSTEGHIQPGWMAAPMPQPPVPPQPWTPTAPPSQPPPAAENPPSSSGQTDSEVKS